MKQLVSFVFACAACIACGQAHALGDQWYIGIGGGSSWLQPNAVEPGVGIERRLGTGGHLFVGLDVDDRSSAQLTLYGLGDSELENQEIVTYYAFDGSVLYRFYDSIDTNLRREGFHVALYGRFALGYMDREKDVELSNDATVYFGAGGGAELFFTDNFSVRLEGLYHDRDAASASLQLVGRFGGRSRAPARPPVVSAPPIPEPVTPAPTIPAPSVPEPSVAVPSVPVPSVPTPVVPAVPVADDFDGDRVADAQDKCPGSRVGFPVRANGCALFDGVLSGVKFAQGSPELLPGATAQLDFLADVLAQYPQARIELHAHTDNAGTVRDQAILTRGRLKTIGTYLVRKGVRSNRLVLRSFGGTRPLYDNASDAGRDGNNRIEVLEKTN